MPENDKNSKNKTVLGHFSNRDLIYMAISMFFAIILWIYVLNVENPSREKIVRQVQLTFSGEEKLNSNQKLMVKGERAEILGEVTVVVNVPASKYSDVTNNTVKAIVDLSSITEPGTYSLDITASVTGMTGVSIVSISQSKVELEVDIIRERILPVEINFEGDAPEGYWYSATTVTPSTIALTGASSELSKIDKAVCTIDKSTLNKSIYDSMPITLYDGDGNEISGSNFSGDLLFTTVQIDVLPTKTVPLNITNALLGAENLKAGYQLVGATIAPQATVTIAAKQAVLDTISEISIEPINLSGMYESTLLYDVGLQLPDGARLASATQYNVFVEIEEKYINKDYFDVPIEIRNVPDGASAKLSASTGKVTLTGQISVMEAYQKKNLKLYVDASGLSSGEYIAPVKIEIGDEYSLISSVYWPVNVTLTIEKQP